MLCECVHEICYLNKDIELIIQSYYLTSGVMYREGSTGREAKLMAKPLDLYTRIEAGQWA
jgi:hypothetical protein